MFDNKKTLTIITPHFQDIDGLLETWNSIKIQKSNEWEWIIIDSFTKDFFNKIPNEILINKSIKIYQIKSSIYDAMNFGILKSKTKYFHFLNCKSTYVYKDNLSKIISILNKNGIYDRYICSFQMLIKQKKGSINIQTPDNESYPFNSGHESTIYPTCTSNKILIRGNLGIVADMIFMLEYSFYFKLRCYRNKFVNYPKGGYSDSKYLFNDKLKGYFYLFKLLLLRLKILASFKCLYRILVEIKIKFFSF